MQRQIKFRLRDEKNKIVGYEKWYIGAFNMEHKKDYYAAQPCWLYSKNGELWNPHFIPHRYKDQYTGLTDKNGKEIYEGDILEKQAYDGDSVHTLITEVIFCDGGFCLKKLSGSPKSEIGTIMSFPNGMPEIVGNIFENPELLMEAAA